MDTNVDNYNNNEIITLLKIRNDESLTVDILADKIDRTIQKIKRVESEDTPDLIKFFQDCFVRVCLMKGFEITETHRDTLSLPPLPIIPENIVVPGKDDNVQLIHPKVFPGNLTEAVPTAQSISAYSRPYARGTVNPVERETIKYLLTINSKFRDEYKPYNCYTNYEEQETFPSQGDLIRDKTFCRNNPAIVKRVVDLEACSKSTNRGYKNPETDFTILLQEPLTNVVSIKLAGLEMMNGYYPISEYLGTNVFRITTFQFNKTMPPVENGNISNVTEHTISISQGCYSVTEIMNTINCTFLESSVLELRAVELKYDCLTGRFHFVLRTVDADGNEINPTDSNNAFAFQLDFRHPIYPKRSLYYNLGWMMGFRESIYTMAGSYITCPTTTCLLGISGEAPANLIGTHYFLVEVDDFNNNNPVVLNYNCDTEFSFNIRNILGKVPNAANCHEILFEDSSDRIFKSRKYFGPVRINKLKIRILDENGRQINLNNSDFTINIEVETLNTPYKNMVR